MEAIAPREGRRRWTSVSDLYDHGTVHRTRNNSRLKGKAGGVPLITSHCSLSVASRQCHILHQQTACTEFLNSAPNCSCYVEAFIKRLWATGLQWQIHVSFSFIHMCTHSTHSTAPPCPRKGTYSVSSLHSIRKP